MLAEWARRAADGSDSDEEGGEGKGHGHGWRGNGKNRRKSVEMRAGELVPPVGVLHYSAGKARNNKSRGGLFLFGGFGFGGGVCGDGRIRIHPETNHPHPHRKHTTQQGQYDGLINGSGADGVGTPSRFSLALGSAPASSGAASSSQGPMPPSSPATPRSAIQTAAAQLQQQVHEEMG